MRTIDFPTKLVMRWIWLLSVGAILNVSLNSQQVLGPWKVDPKAIDLRNGKVLIDREGRLVRVYRSPETKAFLLLDAKFEEESGEICDNTLILYESSGRKRWSLRLKGLNIEACRLAQGGRFVHLGVAGCGAQGYDTPCILTLDARGKDISRLGKVNDAGQKLIHVNRTGTALYTGLLEDHPGDTNRWSLCYIDFQNGCRWTRSFEGGKGPKEPGFIAALSASGSHTLFIWDSTVFSWSADNKELWRRKFADFQGLFSLSDDGQRLIRWGLNMPLACYDNLSGHPLWQVPVPGCWEDGFVEGTHLAFWYGWEPKDLPPVQAKSMSLVILDEKGLERDRFFCPVPKEAVYHSVRLSVKAGRIVVWLGEKRLMSRNAAWMEQIR